MTSLELRAIREGHTGGVPVVLLHSICSSADLWLPQMIPWRGVLRTIRVDLPGHGFSPSLGGTPALADYADALAATLDSTDERRIAIVGTSFGSMVAQAFALRYPDRVAALVLAHAGARTSEEVSAIWAQRLQQFDLNGMSAHVHSTVGRWLSADFGQASPLTSGWLAGLVRATSVAGYREAVNAIRGLDHVAALASIACPTLVVAGTQDAAVPMPVVRSVAERIPGAEFATLDAGHMSNVEQPVRFAELVGGFLSARSR